MNDSNRNDAVNGQEGRLRATRAQRRPTAARRTPQDSALRSASQDADRRSNGTEPHLSEPTRKQTGTPSDRQTAVNMPSGERPSQRRMSQSGSTSVPRDTTAPTGQASANVPQNRAAQAAPHAGMSGNTPQHTTGGDDMQQYARRTNRRPEDSGRRGKTRSGSRSAKTPSPTKRESTAVSSLVRAMLYISFVLVISGCLAYFGITAGNDIFAFVKDDSVVEITTTENVTVSSLSKQLYDAGVIRYPSVFRFYAKLRKKDSGLIATTQTVSSSMSYDKLLAAFKQQKKPREEIKVTIPEGYTVEDIIRLFTEEKGIGTREGFVDAINNYEYDYWFIPDKTTLRPGRLYRLEGYLYPDTYYFYTDWSEVSIVNKMLANFETKFDMRYKTRADELGWSVDDVIILASMLQMEAKYETEYAKISSVFHNRLANTYATGGKLESDATIVYVLPAHVDKITNEELKTDSPYNTYLYPGLPPGPIGNPTSYAINYALYPDHTDYYYFVAQPSGYSLFAKTYEEHLRNIAAVEAQSRE